MILPFKILNLIGYSGIMLVADQILQTTKKVLTREGILFILWGWLMFYVNLTGYVERELLLSNLFEKSLNLFGIVIGIGVISMTILHILYNRKSVTHRYRTTIRNSWVAMFGVMVMVNLIQNNVLHSINFELQHAIFMVIIAFTIITTGSILKSQLLIFGGIFFGILGLVASYFPLADQHLIEAVCWFFAIIIPGHLLYHKTKLKNE
ncbi:MAG TPA: hypothetical protein VK172_06080 [Lentimicrobium sp.]|nr:hypothetical protein [Lentimicrobium sp.]